MLLNNRIFWKSGSDLLDLSIKLNDFHTGAETVEILSTDALYIGSDMPFNHRYFQVDAENDEESVVSVSLWSGTQWQAAVDVIDQTMDAGATLAQSGIISWVPDRNSSWTRESTTENITELSTVKIYNFYWAKLTFSEDLAATTEISYIGHKFSDDNDLRGLYPELLLAASMTQFASGGSKTDWNEQHITAAEIIIRDLRRRGVIWSRNQILDWGQFAEMSVRKVAEIAFDSFGEPYEAARKKANDKYHEAFEMRALNVDKNQNATLDTFEKRINAGIRRV